MWLNPNTDEKKIHLQSTKQTTCKKYTVVNSSALYVQTRNYCCSFNTRRDLTVSMKSWHTFRSIHSHRRLVKWQRQETEWKVRCEVDSAFVRTRSRKHRVPAPRPSTSTPRTCCRWRHRADVIDSSERGRRNRIIVAIITAPQHLPRRSRQQRINSSNLIRRSLRKSQVSSPSASVNNKARYNISAHWHTNVLARYLRFHSVVFTIIDAVDVGLEFRST